MMRTAASTMQVLSSMTMTPPLRNTPGKGPPTGHKGPKASYGPEKTAKWPGLPGNAQPRSRDRSGTKKVRAHPTSAGI